MLTKAGHILGYTAVFPDHLVRGNITSHLASIRPSNQVDPKFLALYLTSSLGIRQIYRWGNKATRPELNTDEVRKLLVPLPPIDIQQKLVAEMNAAREARRRKLAQADELLGSLDGWLLEQLGVIIQPKSKTKIFATTLNQAKHRIDAAFHSPLASAIRRSIEVGTYSARTVESFCEAIKSGFAAGRQDQADNGDEGVPHLRPLNLSVFGELTLVGTKYVPKTVVGSEDLCQINEVLFNNTNSEELVGKSTVFDLQTACACSNHMTRLRLTNDASPYFIAALFNALSSTLSISGREKVEFYKPFACNSGVFQCRVFSRHSKTQPSCCECKSFIELTRSHNG